MPIYEYQCRKCGMVFEVIQKMNEGGDRLKCPSCGESKPQKMLSCCSSFTKGSSESASPAPASSCGGGSSHFS